MAILVQDQFDAAILNLVNQERTSRGLVPLSMSEKLDTAADLHSRQMAQQDFFSHTNPVTRSTSSSRIQSAGYTIASNSYGTAENIAAGYDSPESVMAGWMNSSGHRANILNPSYRHLGIGHYYLGNDTGNYNYNRYWTQNFGFGGIPGAYQAEMDSPPPSNSGVINGTSAGDILIGTSGNDTIRGRNGNDTLRGAGGNDVLDGGLGNDRLLGAAGNDRMIGFEGNDVLQGGSGNDILIGVNPGASNALVGRNEKDRLIGSTGADRFILGQNNKVFYDDRQAGSGTKDFALIRGFSANQGDRIQLAGRASDYVLGQSGSGLPSGTKIYFKTGGGDELIGIIQNVTISSTNNGAFRYV